MIVALPPTAGQPGGGTIHTTEIAPWLRVEAYLATGENLEHMRRAGVGADLVVHFQEDETSSPERLATFEVEYRFYNFKAHGHLGRNPQDIENSGNDRFSDGGALPYR